MHQSERLAAALTAAGVSTDLHLYAGANHMWLGAPDAATDAVDRTVAFLRRQLSAATDARRDPNTKGDNR